MGCYRWLKRRRVWTSSLSVLVAVNGHEEMPGTDVGHGETSASWAACLNG